MGTDNYWLRSGNGKEVEIGDLETVALWIGSGHLNGDALLRDPVDGQWKSASNVPQVRALLAPSLDRIPRPQKPAVARPQPRPRVNRGSLVDRVVDGLDNNRGPLFAIQLAIFPGALLALLVNNLISYRSVTLGPDWKAIFVIAVISCVVSFLSKGRVLQDEPAAQGFVFSVSFAAGCLLYIATGLLGITGQRAAVPNTAATVQDILTGNLPALSEITSEQYGPFAARLTEVVSSEWDRVYIVREHLRQVGKLDLVHVPTSYGSLISEGASRRIKEARELHAAFARTMLEIGTGPDLTNDLPVPSIMRVGFEEKVAGRSRERTRVTKNVLRNELKMIYWSEQYLIAVAAGEHFNIEQTRLGLVASHGQFLHQSRNLLKSIDGGSGKSTNQAGSP